MSGSLQESDVLKAFLLLVVVPLLGGVVAGAIMASVLGFGLMGAGTSVKTTRLIITIVGVATALMCSYFALRRLGIPFIARKLLPSPPWPSHPDQGSPEIRVEFRLAYLDYLLFNVAHSFLNPVLQAVVLLLAGIVFVTGLNDKSVAESLLTAGCWYSIMWLVQTAFYAALVYSKREDSNLTDHVLEVREDAIRDVTRFNESRYFWPGILRVVQRPGVIAVYVSQHGAQVIPNRAFDSGEKRRQFVALVKERMRVAKASGGS